MLRLCLAAVVAAASLLASAPAAAGAAALGDLIGRPVDNARGEPVGRFDDFIIDVDAGRVLYAVVDAGGKFYTLPLRAVDEKLRLDMDLANAVARDAAEDPPALRRAGRLLGRRAHEPPARPLGIIRDIVFDLASGRVERVVVDSGTGPLSLAPDVLAHVPPHTKSSRGASRRQGERAQEKEPFVFKPSDERRRLHNPPER